MSDREPVLWHAQGATAKEALGKLPERMADPRAPSSANFVGVAEPTCREDSPGHWVAQRLYVVVERGGRS